MEKKTPSQMMTDKLRELDLAHLRAILNDKELTLLLSKEQLNMAEEGLVSSAEVSWWLMDILC